MQNWCCKSTTLVIFFDSVDIEVVVDSLKIKQLKKSFVDRDCLELHSAVHYGLRAIPMGAMTLRQKRRRIRK